MPNVDIFLDNKLTAEDILGLETPHVVFATGARWRRDGIGRTHRTKQMNIAKNSHVLTPDDVMEGQEPSGKNVVVFDDDYYYLANIIAEKLALDGYNVTLVCSSNELSPWTHATLENDFVNRQMAKAGVKVITTHSLTEIDKAKAVIEHHYTRASEALEADTVVLVTSRETVSEEYEALMHREKEWQAAGIQSVTKIGDADVPGIIAQAVYAGHRYAQEFDGDDIGDAVPFKRSLIDLVEIA
jgi:dimethylamine/trimethylamine dehydrogenase